MPRWRFATVTNYPPALRFSCRVLPHLLLSLSASLASTAVFGQDSSRVVRVSAFVFDESLDLPSPRVLSYRFEPAVQLQVDASLRRRGRHSLLLIGGLGYYRHRELRSAVQVDARLAYRLQLGSFSVAVAAGPGVSQVFAAGPVFAYDDGAYVRKVDYGTPVFSPGGALTMGYALSDRPSAYTVHARVALSVEQPFAALPLPHTFLGFGVSRTLPL